MKVDITEKELQSIIQICDEHKENTSACDESEVIKARKKELAPVLNFIQRCLKKK